MELFLLSMLVNDDRQEAQLASSIRAFGAKTPRRACGELSMPLPPSGNDPDSRFRIARRRTYTMLEISPPARS